MRRLLVLGVLMLSGILTACGSEAQAETANEVEGLFRSYWSEVGNGTAIMQMEVTNHRTNDVELVDVVLGSSDVVPGIAVSRVGSLSAEVSAPPAGEWDSLPLRLDSSDTAFALIEVVVTDCDALGEWEEVDGKASFRSLTTPPLTMVLGDGSEVLSAAFPPTEALTEGLDAAFCG